MLIYSIGVIIAVSFIKGDKMDTVKVLLVFALILTAVSSKDITLCSDENYWYPFSYTNEKGEAAGLYIDMVSRIFENLDYNCTITPLPWKRCLLGAENGSYDGVVGASYKDERAQFLDYPENAAANRSVYYLTKVEYVLVTHKDENYRFRGNVKTVPQPVRGVLGYSIVDDLRKQGVVMHTSTNVRKNMEMLIRSGRGAVITTPHTARALKKEMDSDNSLVIHEKMVTSKAYYLVFSKSKSDISPEERLKIWKECEKLHSDEEFMDSLYRKYENRTESQ